MSKSRQRRDIERPVSFIALSLLCYVRVLILTIPRWATEDPNPTAKVAEKRRLEEIGTAAIQAKIDPRMVDAVRAIRALEDGEEIPSASEEAFDEGIEDADDEEIDADSSRKRRRIEDEYQMQEHSPSPPPQASGLLTAETMEGLKYFALLRQARGGDIPSATPSTVKVAPAKSLGGLGDYGSDEEED